VPTGLPLSGNSELADAQQNCARRRFKDFSKFIIMLSSIAVDHQQENLT
jgi:hypothetical protein